MVLLHFAEGPLPAAWTTVRDPADPGQPGYRTALYTAYPYMSKERLSTRDFPLVFHGVMTVFFCMSLFVCKLQGKAVFFNTFTL